MKKIVFLDSKTLGNIDLSKLDKFGEVIAYETTSKEQVLERVKDANIIITNKVIIDRAVIDRGEKLEIICEAATGFNNIDIEYAKEKKIAVTNVSGYSTDTVVQHTFSMLLHLNDKIAYYDNYIKNGEYSKSEIFTNLNKTFNELSGKTYGIVGLGAIGKKVAKVAESFGCKVVYYSTSGKNNNKEFERLELEEFLKSSDIISIHAPLNENTKGLINYKNIKMMKDSVIIVNMGRGPIVNEEDLARAIDEDIIGGACLDVFSIEPLKEDNPLLKVKNKEKLVMSPHIAWASIEARERLFDGIVKNIEAFYNGEMRNRLEIKK